MCFEFVDGYKCVCLLGFIGFNCEIDEDECVLSLCFKGVICVDKVCGILGNLFFGVIVVYMYILCN